MNVGIDPKVDYAFKRLFGREQNAALLVDLLDAVLQEPPGRRVQSVQLLNPFQDKDYLEDKLSVLDIKARDQSGRQFNVEMQMLAFAAFRPRVLYYWARLHQGQLEEGSDYGDLRPTVSICFVDTVLFPELPGHHAVFELRERTAGVIFSDHLLLHLLELPKFTRGVDQLASPLERWLYFLRHGDDLDPAQLPAPLRQPWIERALGELQMMSQNELERERYEARLKGQRDFATALAEARREGEAAGLQQAMREGLVRQLHLCERLLGRTPSPAASLRDLPLTELELQVQRLEAELTGPAAGP